jgi:hypothetical protein
LEMPLPTVLPTPAVIVCSAVRVLEDPPVRGVQAGGQRCGWHDQPAGPVNHSAAPLHLLYWHIRSRKKSYCGLLEQTIVLLTVKQYSLVHLGMSSRPKRPGLKIARWIELRLHVGSGLGQNIEPKHRLRLGFGSTSQVGLLFGFELGSGLISKPGGRVEVGSGLGFQL